MGTFAPCTIPFLKPSTITCKFFAHVPGSNSDKECMQEMVNNILDQFQEPKYDLLSLGYLVRLWCLHFVISVTRKTHVDNRGFLDMECMTGHLSSSASKVLYLLLVGIFHQVKFAKTLA